MALLSAARAAEAGGCVARAGGRVVRAGKTHRLPLYSLRALSTLGAQCLPVFTRNLQEIHLTGQHSRHGREGRHFQVDFRAVIPLL